MMTDVILSGLLLWYVNTVVTDNFSGPFGLIRRLKNLFTNNEGDAGMLDCPYCFGFWASILLGVLYAHFGNGELDFSLALFIGGSLSISLIIYEILQNIEVNREMAGALAHQTARAEYWQSQNK